jgi:hypothetical protein
MISYLVRSNDISFTFINNSRVLSNIFLEIIYTYLNIAIVKIRLYSLWATDRRPKENV